MNVILVLVISIYLPLIHTENIYLNPGEEQLNSVFAGDDLTLICPVNNTKGPVKWSIIGTPSQPADTILSDGMKLNSATFRFNVSFTNSLKQFIYLRIYNISLNEQHVYNCYYFTVYGYVIEYHFTVKLANIPNVLIKGEDRTICCAVNGTNINATSITLKQRILFDEHIRFVKSDQIKRSEMLISSQPMFCMNINELVSYIRKERYICMAQISINGRKQTINRTTSLEKRNIEDRPLCIEDKRIQRSIIGSNISVVTNFYSKSEYYNISFRKEDGEHKFVNNLSVSSKNISVDIFNVSVIVTGYEIIISITEFSDEDIGNYTIEMYNEFRSSMCTLQLQPHVEVKIKSYPSGSVCEGQSVIFICQSTGRIIKDNYSWTKNGVLLSNSSSIVLENLTQADKGNYTCRVKDKQRYLTKNELLNFDPLTCRADLIQMWGFLEMTSFLGLGMFTILFVILISSVICNIAIHLYCKRVRRVNLETYENDITTEHIEMTEIDNGYHTIIEDNLRLADTEMENTPEIRITLSESSNESDIQLPGAAFGGIEFSADEEDYLHPYCTVMQSTIDVHEYRDLGPGVVDCGGKDEESNKNLVIIYENIKH